MWVDVWESGLRKRLLASARTARLASSARALQRSSSPFPVVLVENGFLLL